jgi:hypothetical protein
MMKPKWTMIAGALVLGLLAACGPASTGAVGLGGGQAAQNGGTTVENPAQVRLQDNYADALSIQGQLAAGTMMLEDTPLAVDEGLAGELLPLWQAVQSLSNSDTAAPVEITAVLNQIQDSMEPEQVAAIAALNLTADSLATMIEEGTLAFGFSGRGQTDDGTGGQTGGFPSGRPGGGIPGGGIPGGGFSGGGAGGLDPEALATRQAQFASGETDAMQERMLLGAVVRLMGTKTGEISADRPARIFDTVFTLVSEATGLSVEDIQAQTAEGTTLAEIVTANGGDIEAVHTALIEALGAQPELADQDLNLLADQWLGLEK